MFMFKKNHVVFPYIFAFSQLLILLYHNLVQIVSFLRTNHIHL